MNSIQVLLAKGVGKWWCNIFHSMSASCINPNIFQRNHCTTPIDKQNCFLVVTYNDTTNKKYLSKFQHMVPTLFGLDFLWDKLYCMGLFIDV